MTAGKRAPCQVALHAAIPIWSCSRWGLPCRVCYQTRGALLPHRFTLTVRVNPTGGLFSVALSLGSPPAAVSRHRVYLEPGLSSRLLQSERPSDRLERSLALLAPRRQGPQLNLSYFAHNRLHHRGEPHPDLLTLDPHDFAFDLDAIEPQDELESLPEARLAAKRVDPARLHP